MSPVRYRKSQKRWLKTKIFTYFYSLLFTSHQKGKKNKDTLNKQRRKTTQLYLTKSTLFVVAGSLPNIH